VSVFHNASGDVVKFALHDASKRLVEHVVLPGDECSVPDVYDAAVPCLAPQMKKGSAPEPAPVAAVPPPPKDPKKQAQGGT
jgi:hypothetical protein